MISTSAGLFGRRLGFRQHRRDKTTVPADKGLYVQSTSSPIDARPDDLGTGREGLLGADGAASWNAVIALAPTVGWHFVSHPLDSTPSGHS
jgi:hypothetical protein